MQSSSTPEAPPPAVAADRPLPLTALLARLPLLAGHRPLAYGAVLALVAFAWWLRWTLDMGFPPGFPYLTFFPAVIVSSFLFGRGPGILAAAIAGVVAWYWFIPPRHGFAINGGVALALGFYLAIVAVDIALIHWMQRANATARVEQARSAALTARTELLFNELQHRVANNLQMAASVLALQQRSVVDPAARAALTEAANKLRLIGRIQRQLYGTSAEPVALDAFVDQLVADLAAGAGKPGIVYRVTVASGLTFAPDMLIPLALIVAEGIANAVEHGFADREEGCVTLDLIAHAAMLRLEIADDGRGLPAGFDLERATSLGLRIARTLARQLGGTLAVEPGGHGTVTRLEMPLGVRSP